ncbi:AIG2-like family protein [Gimesia panareensis]|uniref:AIG2-like family protein n=1 Tax=Gimesia panareensis TaxID=2527978 RepID=A0A518FRS4_9PLAN|nr:gamma-glutamylcyclotransferase family protein [Gimesia panareensis]QDV19049.1 AIG2-like family protein [Gimesia panareensis]
MTELLNYFAYGSNLHPARLQARIGVCAMQGAALLENAELRFHKVGIDASGKCDITLQETTAEGVWGAVYQISLEQKQTLDRFESLGQGYQIRELEVLTQTRESVRVFTYQAMTEFIDPGLQPFDWYHELVVEGARFHQFPADYLERLLQIELLIDSDAERVIQARELLRSIEDFRDQAAESESNDC